MNFQSIAWKICPQIPLVVMWFVCLSAMRCFESSLLYVQLQPFCFETLEKLTRACDCFWGWWRGTGEDEDLAPSSKAGKRQAELQTAGQHLYLGCFLAARSPLWLGLRKNFLQADFSLFSPLYWNVLISCHFPRELFCHKKDSSIACYLQNLESHNKDLKREAGYSAPFIYSRDRL